MMELLFNIPKSISAGMSLPDDGDGVIFAIANIAHKQRRRKDRAGSPTVGGLLLVLDMS